MMAIKNLDLYKLGVKLDVDGAKGLLALSKADKELKAVEQDGRRAEKSIGLVGGALSKLSGGIKSVTGSSGVGSILPGLSHVSNIISAIPQVGNLIGSIIAPMKEATEEGINFNAFLETSEIAFKKMLGSRGAAVSFMKELRGFAGASPFRTEGLVKTAQYMGAVGFKGKEVIPVLTDVGDAISATGEISEEAVQNVVRALGKMRGVGKVSAEEMESLADNGIPAWEMLAHAIGKTVAETRKLSEQGKLNGPAAVEAIRAEMRARYGGMMDELQNTYKGRRSAAEDAMQEAQAIATLPLFKDISGMYAAALTRTDLAKSLADKIGALIAPVSGMVRLSAETLVGGSITDGVAKGITDTSGVVMKAVSDMGLGSVWALMEAIGARSPARKFIPVGHYAAQGFILGLQQGIRVAHKEPAKQIKRMTDEIEEEIQKNAQRTGLDPDLIRAVIRQESGGKRKVVSGVGAQGLMQLMPATARRFGVTNAFDPAQNIRGGTTYLAWLLKRFNGNVPLALAGYNAGEGAVDKYKGMPPYRETRGYVNSVMAMYEREKRRRGDTPQESWKDKFGEQGRVMPVEVVNVEELRGIDLTKLTPLPKFPNHDEKGNVTGYDSYDPSEQQMTNAQAVAGLAKLNATIQAITYKSAVDAQQQTIERLNALNTSLAEIPPALKGAATGLTLLPESLRPIKPELKNAEVAAGSFAKSVIMSSRDMKGAFAQIAGFLPQGQSAGKRGFFSKLLGVAAPFLGFIPGVGPILSTLASIGSSAAAGDWGGALLATAGGFARGGAFRGSGGSGVSSSASEAAGSSAGAAAASAFGNLPRRAAGGPVRRGRAYIVGEHRQEVFEPDEDGWIHPSIASFSRGGGAGGGMGGMIDGLLEQVKQALEQNTQATVQLHTRVESMRAGDMLAIGARQNPGAIGEGIKTAMSRDPRVTEWMTRRVNGQ
jgi:tape measure domain-containing protein